MYGVYVSNNAPSKPSTPTHIDYAGIKYIMYLIRVNGVAMLFSKHLLQGQGDRVADDNSNERIYNHITRM